MKAMKQDTGDARLAAQIAAVMPECAWVEIRQHPVVTSARLIKAKLWSEVRQQNAIVGMWAGPGVDADVVAHMLRKMLREKEQAG